MSFEYMQDVALPALYPEADHPAPVSHWLTQGSLPKIATLLLTLTHCTFVPSELTAEDRHPAPHTHLLHVCPCRAHC